MAEWDNQDGVRGVSGKRAKTAFLTAAHVQRRIMAHDSLTSAHLIAKLESSNSPRPADESENAPPTAGSRAVKSVSKKK